jgi:hypothetical protein
LGKFAPEIMMVAWQKEDTTPHSGLSHRQKVLEGKGNILKYIILFLIKQIYFEIGLDVFGMFLEYLWSLWVRMGGFLA